MDENRPATRALMACLGDPSRFRLVHALIAGPRCVSDLAAEVGLSQSCTTRHLQALEKRSVVRGARDGKRVLYRIRDDRTDLMPLIGWAMEERAAARGKSGSRPAGSRPGREVAPARNGGRNGARAASAPAPRPTRIRLDRRPVPQSSFQTAETLQVAATPAGVSPVTFETQAPPRPAVEEPPVQARRRPGTDIEDFLL